MNVRQLATRTVGPVHPGPAPPPRPADAPAGASFADALRRAQQPTAEPLTLSAHAEQRIQQRSISMTASERSALAEAVEHLEAKGARDALVLRPDAAFVVHVPNRTVVTALARGDLDARVFTGIDSALVL